MDISHQIGNMLIRQTSHRDFEITQGPNTIFLCIGEVEEIAAIVEEAV